MVVPFQRRNLTLRAVSLGAILSADLTTNCCKICMTKSTEFHKSLVRQWLLNRVTVS